MQSLVGGMSELVYSIDRYHERNRRPLLPKVSIHNLKADMIVIQFDSNVRLDISIGSSNTVYVDLLLWTMPFPPT